MISKSCRACPNTIGSYHCTSCSEYKDSLGPANSKTEHTRTISFKDYLTLNAEIIIAIKGSSNYSAAYFAEARETVDEFLKFHNVKIEGE